MIENQRKEEEENVESSLRELDGLHEIFARAAVCMFDLNKYTLKVADILSVKLRDATKRTETPKKNDMPTAVASSPVPQIIMEVKKGTFAEKSAGTGQNIPPTSSEDRPTPKATCRRASPPGMPVQPKEKSATQASRSSTLTTKIKTPISRLDHQRTLHPLVKMSPRSQKRRRRSIWTLTTSLPLLKQIKER